MRYLCLDYGLAHVGVAFSQGQLAEPLLTLPTKKVVESVKDLVSEYRIDKLVLGLSEGVMQKPTKQLGKTLSKETKLEVDYWDETLSSQMVSSHLVHAKKSKRQLGDHHFAAAIILQDYLDNLERGLC